MKLMIKALIIISLVSSVMSCKLYEKLLDKVEDSLEKEVSIKSPDKPDTDAVTDMQDTSEQNSGRSGRRVRSVADASQSGQEEAAVGGDVNGSREDPGQIVVDQYSVVAENSVSDKDVLTNAQKDVLKQFDKEYREAKDISEKVDSYLKVVGGISEDLEEIKYKLDEMKDEITNVEADFKKARNGSNREAKKILSSLHQAIDKVKASRNYADLTFYTDAEGSLEGSKSSFNNAKSQAEIALSDIKSIDRAMGVSYNLHKAKESLSRAEKQLEEAKENQEKLKTQMIQVDKEFDVLKSIWGKLKEVMKN
ncbi:hypothetical protein DB313_05990 (plasmid) [Borrelia turcica IST7]|uniref:Uncharacterized protein n=1 Tax=Borrelia turcica IST7 TaxID=1104446 RepID=A0A386PPH0_9SPIR|nr:hypothetical protein [Borrelia turcica]AYE37052.1 hypothetical protein DB313_05990 [Borrelia turcica IST7]